jgi:hypothetical protein
MISKSIRMSKVTTRVSKVKKEMRKVKARRGRRRNLKESS